MIQVYFRALLLYHTRHLLPHLPRSVFRIKELLNKTRLPVFFGKRMFARKGLRKHISQGLAQRQPLNALRSTLGSNVGTRNAPNFFRIFFKERQVQLFAESVNKKIFERSFGPYGKQSCAHIACADAYYPCNTQIGDSGSIQCNRIVEELSQIKYA